MDIVQLEQIVNWLDEEHRRNRNEIVRLNHLVETQNADLVDQTKRIQELEAALSSVESHVHRMQQFETALAHTRQELMSLHEREEDQRRRMQRDLERSRVSEREGIRRDISNLQRELGRISQVEQSVLLRDEELGRLNEMLQDLTAQAGRFSKELEERTQHMPFLLETRASEQKRFKQMQEEQVECFQKLETLGQQIAQKEDDWRKLRNEMTELQGIGERVDRNLDACRDEFRGELFDLAHRLRTLDTAMQEIPAHYEPLQAQIKAIIPFQDSAQKAFAEVRLLRDRLDQGLQQIREAERMFQEKMEKILDDVQTETGERERKNRMKQDHLWQEQENLNMALQERFLPVQQNLRMHEELIKHLWTLHETYPQLALKAAQEEVENMHNALRARDHTIRTVEDEWISMRRNQELYARNGQGAAQDPNAGKTGNGAG